MPTRRTVLIAGTVALAAPAVTYAATPLILNPRPSRQKLGPGDVPETAIWGYNGIVPGQEVRIRQGARVSARLENGLDQPTTIHWHGIRIDNAMDGVAALTQDPVPPGESFDYDFTAPDAGTFWYHPHNRTWEQMARGLYGPLIVEEAEPPAYDRELVLMLDDWRLGEDGQIDEESFGSLRDWSHAGRLGNWPTVNGTPQPDYPVKQNERLRLRILNAANASVLVLRLDGMDAQIVAHDGMPVSPVRLDGTITLAPAQRVDLIADVTGDESGLWLAGRENFKACGFPISGSKRPKPLTDPVASSPTDLDESIDLDDPLRQTIEIQGGAMGGMAEARIGGFGARYRGEEVPTASVEMRDLAQQHDLVWALNGTAGMPLDPLFRAERGQSVVLRFVNDGRWPHAMHVHGHHFRETREGAPWRDTILLNPREAKEVAFVADNPGRWMIHCHMLEHQAGGMGTWFVVA